MREDILVVLVIESVGGHHVLVHRGVAGHAWVGRGPPPDEVGEASVNVGGDGDAVGDEGRALGDPDRVGAGEHDHVLGAEALGREAGDELVEVKERWRQVVEGLRGIGNAAIEAARRHVDLDLHFAKEVGCVAASKGDDVGARDHVGARLLDGVLGRVDHLEATPHSHHSVKYYRVRICSSVVSHHSVSQTLNCLWTQSEVFEFLIWWIKQSVV